MSVIQYGDLLEAKVDFIVHQCNCLTVRGAGLAEQIESMFPFAALYSKRSAIGSRNIAMVTHRGTPGTYHIFESSSSPKGVIALLGQWRPGKIPSPYQYPEYETPETQELREQWFQKALWAAGRELRQRNRRFILGFPERIGCGLAGGRWSRYRKILQEFEIDFSDCINVVCFTLNQRPDTSFTKTSP